MRAILSLALAFAAVPAGASMSIDCSVDVRLDVKVTKVELDQQVGSERLECRGDAASGETQVHVVRIVKTSARAKAEADARADGRASGRYSDSCSCSGTSCSGSCHTSGSGSDSCSDSSSESDSGSGERETSFTVARAGAGSLAYKGFQVAGNGAECELKDPSGGSLDLLRAIALVTYAYGEELMARVGADLAGLKRSQEPKGAPLLLFNTKSPAAVPAFEGRKP